MQLKHKVLHNWQFRIDVDFATSRAYNVNNLVGRWFIPSKAGKYSKYLLQFAAGHHGLRSSEVLRNQQCETSLCTCGTTETFEHFMYRCGQYSLQRHKLLNMINSVVSSRQFGNISEVPLSILFGQHTSFTQKQNLELSSSLIDFIKDSGRFKWPDLQAKQLVTNAILYTVIPVSQQSWDNMQYSVCYSSW